MAQKRWRCVDCGYIHVGDEPPEFCPECYSPKDAFVEVTGEEE
jgi:rubrerythrin